MRWPENGIVIKKACPPECLISVKQHNIYVCFDDHCIRLGNHRVIIHKSLKTEKNVKTTLTFPLFDNSPSWLQHHSSSFVLSRLQVHTEDRSVLSISLWNTLWNVLWETKTNKKKPTVNIFDVVGRSIAVSSTKTK